MAQFDRFMGPAPKVRQVALGNVNPTTTVVALQPNDTEVWATGTLTSNAVIGITGLTPGIALKLFLSQDATGNRTVSLKLGTGTAVPVQIDGTPLAVNELEAYSNDGATLQAYGPGLSSNDLPAINTTAITAAATAAVNTHVLADATSQGFGLVVTLPTGQAAKSVISVQKTDATTNAVISQGNIRGAPATNLTLSLQNESVFFEADSTGSWWPVASHKPLDGLDTRYAAAAVVAGVVNVKAYGAKGDYSVDDSAAIQAAINSLNSGNTFDYSGTSGTATKGGTVFLPAGNYKIGTPLQMRHGVRLVGAGRHATTLHNTTATQYVITTDATGASHWGVEELCIIGDQAMTAGGGIDANKTWAWCTLKSLHLSDNLFTCLNLAPSRLSGHYVLENIIFHARHGGIAGITGVTNAILIGDGTNHTNEIYMTDIQGTAAAGSGVTNWIIIQGHDTLYMKGCGFFGGVNGIQSVQAVGGANGGYNSGIKLHGVYFDSTSGINWDLNYCRDWDIVGCNAQGHGVTGTPANAAVTIGPNNKAVRWTGGSIHISRNRGMQIAAGSTGVLVQGAQIVDSNSLNTASEPAILVKAGATKFKIADCYIANNVISGGRTKVGVTIETGASNSFAVIGNLIVPDADLTTRVTNGTTGGTSGTTWLVTNNVG